MKTSGRLLVIVALALGGGGCAAMPRQNLGRATRAFEQNSHERALAILRDLEQDFLLLPPDDRARYAYVRGMTDYRMGYRVDARYWLAFAKGASKEHPQALAPEWLARLDAALDDINEEVWSRGIEGLENNLKRGGGESHPGAAKPAPPEDEP